MSTKPKTGAIDETEVRFFLAEDFREEANNKVSAVGLFPDCRVLLQMPSNISDPTPEKPAVLRSLSLLFSIFNAPVTASVSIDLQTPSSTQSLVPNHVLPSNRLSESSANFIVRFDPCIVETLGVRKLVVKVNQREYTFNYFFGRQSAVHQVAAKVLRPPKRAASSPVPSKASAKKTAR